MEASPLLIVLGRFLRDASKQKGSDAYLRAMSPILAFTFQKARALLLATVLNLGYDRTVISRIFSATSKTAIVDLVMSGTLYNGEVGGTRKLTERQVKKMNNLCDAYPFVHRESLEMALKYKALKNKNKNKSKKRASTGKLARARKKHRAQMEWNGFIKK